MPSTPLTWQKEEIEATNNKTRKFLTMYGGLHPKFSTLRLYTKWKERGQGLVSVRTTIQDETTKIQEKIWKMDPNDEMLSDCLRKHKTQRRRKKKRQ